jgi:hypothetical protein
MPKNLLMLGSVAGPKPVHDKQRPWIRIQEAKIAPNPQPKKGN